MTTEHDLPIQPSSATPFAGPLTALALVFLGYGLNLGRRELAPVQAASPSIAATWSATLVEQAAWRGLQAEYERLDRDVAAVVTESSLRSRLIQVVALRMKTIEKTQEDFFTAVRAGHCVAGTPLTYDGISWATTETR